MSEENKSCPDRIHTNPASSSNPAKRVQFWDSEVLIVILGATGSGKTTFLNAAAGYEAGAVGHSIKSSRRKPSFIEGIPLTS